MKSQNQMKTGVPWDGHHYSKSSSGIPKTSTRKSQKKNRAYTKRRDGTFNKSSTHRHHTTTFSIDDLDLDLDVGVFDSSHHRHHRAKQLPRNLRFAHAPNETNIHVNVPEPTPPSSMRFRCTRNMILATLAILLTFSQSFTLFLVNSDNKLSIARRMRREERRRYFERRGGTMETHHQQQQYQLQQEQQQQQQENQSRFNRNPNHDRFHYNRAAVALPPDSVVDSSPGKLETQTDKTHPVLLTQLVHGEDIIGDVSHLLDVAIVGFSQCGTTTMKHYLASALASANNQSFPSSLAHNEKKRIANKVEAQSTKEAQAPASGILMLPQERCEVGHRTASLVRSLYYAQRSSTMTKNNHHHHHHHNTNSRDKKNLVTAIACPHTLDTPHALQSYTTYFPRTKFIMGVRHPILWFQSAYNFRVQSRGMPLPPPEELIGNGCVLQEGGGGMMQKKHQSVCTHQVRFPYFLSMLDKTKLMMMDDGEDNEEWRLVFDSKEEWRNHSKLVKSTHGDGGGSGGGGGEAQVFLYEVTQLYDFDITDSSKPATVLAARRRRSNAFRESLQEFLNLQPHVLPQTMKHMHKHPGNAPGAKAKIKQQQQQQRKKAAEDGVAGLIRICDAKHEKVRKVLLDYGQRASKWIREHFLESADVTVPSPAHFTALLRRWESDPCLV